MPLCQTFKILLWAVSLLLLAACDGDKSDTAFERYLSRLANSLGEDAPELTTPELPFPPRASRLKIEIPKGTLNALDFLALSGCDLQITVGKRNSSLGRFARDSQRLLLELELLPTYLLFQ